jgi:hypothetical protein
MVPDAKEYPTRDTSLVGSAGVHHVVSELNLRGLIALATIRNTAGVDVLVANREGTWHANLQVKASRTKVNFWPVGGNWNRWVGPRNFYVFLRYDAKLPGFEAFLESSEILAENVAAGMERDKVRGKRQWAPCFHPKADLARLREQWETFGTEV